MFSTDARRFSLTAFTSATALAAAVACVSATAQQVRQAPTLESHLASVAVVDLEHAFWVCDYIATTRRADDIATCRAVYEALKERKFDGDFDRLLAWWQRNKIAEHARLTAAQGSGLR